MPVARLKSATLAELRDRVRKMFGEGPFESGQTLDETRDGGAIDDTEEMPGELVRAFSKAALQDARSPIIAHEAKSGAVRFLQLGPEGEEQISLVAGRTGGKDSQPNDKVFRVEQRWVQRLVEWDTCTRAVAADTRPAAPCGAHGCPVLMTGQSFIHPSGEIEDLLLWIGRGESEAVLQEHANSHVQSSKHCNTKKDATGKCSLDCGQTAR